MSMTAWPKIVRDQRKHFAKAATLEICLIQILNVAPPNKNWFHAPIGFCTWKFRAKPPNPMDDHMSIYIVSQYIYIIHNIIYIYIHNIIYIYIHNIIYIYIISWLSPLTWSFGGKFSSGPMGPIFSFRTSENHIAPGNYSAVAPQGGEGAVGRFNLRHLIGSTKRADVPRTGINWG